MAKEVHKNAYNNTNKNDDFSITYSKEIIFRWALGLFQQSQAVVHIKREKFYIKEHDTTSKEKLSTERGKAH